jgi:hypothetical protein
MISLAPHRASLAPFVAVPALAQPGRADQQVLERVCASCGWAQGELICIGTLVPHCGLC